VLAAVLLASALKQLGAPSMLTAALAVVVGLTLVSIMLVRGRRSAPQPDKPAETRDTAPDANLRKV
jgi:hypothetical protein